MEGSLYERASSYGRSNVGWIIAIVVLVLIIIGLGLGLGLRPPDYCSNDPVGTDCAEGRKDGEKCLDRYMPPNFVCCNKKCTYGTKSGDKYVCPAAP